MKAIDKEIKRLRESGYAEPFGWTMRKNGRTMSIEELAAENVANASASRKKFKEMGETGQCAALHGTDKQYLNRFGCNGKQHAHNPVLGEMLKKQKPGWSPGAVYSSIGKWVTSKSEIIAEAKRRNLNLELDGRVENTAHAVPPPESVPLSEQAIGGLMAERIAKDPSLAENKKKIKKLRMEVLDKHTPHWKKHLIKE